MNLFALSGLLVGIFCLFLVIVLLFYPSKKKAHVILIFFNVAVSVWGFGCLIVGISSTATSAVLGWKIAHLGGFFISILFYHLVCEFCSVKRPVLIKFGYLQASLFNFFNWCSDSLITETRFTFGLFYNNANGVLSLAIIAYLILVIASFRELFVYMNSPNNENKIQTRYVLFGFLIGFIGGTSTFLPEYGADIFYPFGNLGIVVYVLIVTYAILRHQIMNIKLGISRLIVYIILVSLTIGLPLGVFYVNLFSLSGILIAVTCLGLTILVLCHSLSSRLHIIWAFFNLVVSVWGVGVFMVGRATSEESALIAWRIAFIGALFTCVLFYHTVCVFGNLNRKKFLIYSYAQGIFFAFLTVATNLIFNHWHILFDSLYYNKAGIWYYILIINWTTVTFFAHYELFRLSIEYTGYKRIQALYLFYGSLIGFLGGVFSLLPAFGVYIYPVINFTIPIYAAVETYAILRYRLLDIRIAVTRLGISGLVYSLVLGLPFCIGFFGRNYLESMFYHWWLVPTGICAALATAGPFIYLFLQRKAEKHILQEEVRTQNLLLQASYGMNTIHDLDHLVNLIVEVVMKILRVRKVEIYLLGQDGSQYRLAAPKDDDNPSTVISASDPFIETLKNNKFPIVYEEIKIHSENMNSGADYPAITEQMETLLASVAVPIIINGTLLGFLTLSDRKSKEMYSRDLLNALIVLGNQAALAIENCHYLEAETKRMEEEGVRERMVSLDHMASSMAHEIDNPNTVILNQADLIIEALDRDPRTSIPDEIRKDIVGGLRFIQESSSRVSDMIRAVLEYSRMGTGQLKPIKIYDALASFEKLISPELKKTGVEIKKDVENDLPYILGDKIQIEEIFMNLTTNSLHAVKYKEGQKRVGIKIFKKDDKFIRIECSDNGYGIPKNMLNDIFLASVTTKGSVEGTGLGLYRIRKIVDKHKGRIWAESEGKDKGATFIVELPIHKGEFTDIIKDDDGKPRSKKVF